MVTLRWLIACATRSNPSTVAIYCLDQIMGRNFESSIKISFFKLKFSPFLERKLKKKNLFFGLKVYSPRGFEWSRIEWLFIVLSEYLNHPRSDQSVHRSTTQVAQKTSATSERVCGNAWSSVKFQHRFSRFHQHLDWGVSRSSDV